MSRLVRKSSAKEKRKTRSLQEDIEQSNILWLIIKLSIPAVIAVAVSGVYNLVDTFFITYLGSSAVAGVSVVFAGMALLQTAGYTVGMGAASRISIALGDKKTDYAITVLRVGLLLAVTIGIALLIFACVFEKRLYYWLGATDSSYAFAAQYGRYILWSAPVVLLLTSIGCFLRALGNTKAFMYATLAGGGSNILLDIVFVRQLDMELTGAALATLCSQIVGLLVIISYWIGKKSTVSFAEVLLIRKDKRKRNCLNETNSRRMKTAGEILKNGVPSLCRQGAISLSIVAVNAVAGRYCDQVVMALSIVGKIFLIVYAAAIGISQAYQPIAGVLYGAKNGKRLKKVYLVTLLFGTLLMTGLGILLFYNVESVLRLFHPERKVYEIAKTALRWQIYAMPFMMLGNLVLMTYQAFKKPWKASFYAMLRQGICFLPLLYVLPMFFSVNGILMAQPIADVLTFLLCVPVSIGLIRRLPSHCRHDLKHKL